MEKIPKISKIGKNLEKTSKRNKKHPKQLYEPKIQQWNESKINRMNPEP